MAGYGLGGPQQLMPSGPKMDPRGMPQVGVQQRNPVHAQIAQAMMARQPQPRQPQPMQPQRAVPRMPPRMVGY